jgi:hypothetical protein
MIRRDMKLCRFRLSEDLDLRYDHSRSYGNCSLAPGHVDNYLGILRINVIEIEKGGLKFYFLIPSDASSICSSKMLPVVITFWKQ